MTNDRTNRRRAARQRVSSPPSAAASAEELATLILAAGEGERDEDLAEALLDEPPVIATETARGMLALAGVELPADERAARRTLASAWVLRGALRAAARHIATAATGHESETLEALQTTRLAAQTKAILDACDPNEWPGPPPFLAPS